MATELRANLLSVAIVLSVSVAGALITSTLVASRAYQVRGEQIKKSDQVLAVTGSARRRIQSDLAVWHVRVSGEAKELKDAFAILKSGLERVNKFLETRKFRPDEIGVSAINTQSHYHRDKEGNETRELLGYTLERTFTISSARVELVAGAAAEVTELIQDGVRVVSLSPEYHYTKLADLKIQMIGEASRDARTRAEQIAANSGCAVTEVRNARMGVMQITRPHSTEVSDAGVNDTSSIEKDVMSVVSLSLGLETRPSAQ